MSLDLGDVETFLALAEELHFARTAERLRLSSARVTQRIQALEREVGAPLFERTSRRVTLTPLGERLRDDLRGAYDGLLAAVATARAAARKPAGPLRIGFTETTAGESLNALVRAIERGYPQIDVTLHQVPLITPLDPLRANDIDVLVNWLVFDHPDLTQGPPLSRHAMVLMTAADHPLARQASVTFEEAADYEFLALSTLWRQVSRPLFFPLETPSGRQLRFHAEVETWQETVSHVARGTAVHITVDVMANLLRRSDLAYVPVVDLPPVALGPIWCTARENARVRALVAAIPKTAAQQPAAPTAAQPTATQPTATQEDATQEDAAQPTAAQEDAAQPTATQEDATQEDAAQPTAAQEHAAQPTAAQEDAAQKSVPRVTGSQARNSSRQPSR